MGKADKKRFVSRKAFSYHVSYHADGTSSVEAKLRGAREIRASKAEIKERRSALMAGMSILCFHF